MEAVTITLNGVEVSGHAGMTILDLAQEASVDIPTLCHDPNLAPTGACRLCLVEDERSGALLASCVAPIAPGMVINTHSSRVVEHRKKILKLMLASHPDSCLVCDKGNRCQLRKLAAEMGIGLVEFQRIPQPGAIVEVNPFIMRDLSKCILCGKCVRADQELVVEGAIDYIHRGSATKPATLHDTSLEKSECSFCGTCVAICPTGAIMEKEKAYTGTTTTIIDTICPYCGCGCTISLGVKDGQVVRSRPGMASPVNRGTLCVRGSYGFDFIHSSDRLISPLIKVNGDFQETNWEQALERVAAKFKHLKGAHGPDSLAFFGSSKCADEENYLLQRLARVVLGTNNIDNGSRLYNSASLVGLGSSIGYPGTTNSLDILERSRVIMVIGADPEVSAPAVGYAIKRAVRYKGAELCLIDPRQTLLSSFARLWLRPRAGTDVALLNGLAKVIVDKEKFDKEFVTRMTDNFTPWAKKLEGYTPSYVEEATGVPKRDVKLAASLFAEAQEASIVYGNGITQQANGVNAVVALANLAMLTGNIGRRGGIFALQRENNAHGACDMGTLPDFLPGYQSIGDAQSRKRFEERWGSQLPTSVGLTALEMLEQAREGRVKGMFIMGEGPVASFPQPFLVREALSSLDFLVVTDLFLTETAKLASVVLPAASFAEKEGTFTNFEGRVQRLHKAIQPPGASLPDGEIVLRLAEKLGSPMPYSSYQQVMEEIEEMVPFYNHLTYADLEAGGLDRVNMGSGLLGTGRLHNGLFPSGFGRFSSVEYALPPDGARDGYPLTLLVGSIRYHFGTGSRSSRAPRLSRFCPEAFMEISEVDARDHGIGDGDKVKVISANGELLTIAKVSDALPQGLLFLPISSPDTRVYELFSSILDYRTKAPVLKSCAVRLERTVTDG